MNAIIFPGQGSQYVGMGKAFVADFPRAQILFSTIDRVLGFNLSQLCFDGSSEDLKRTQYQQLAILATSLVAYEVFKEKGVPIHFLSGLSLGEYTCLYPSGVLNLEDVLLLVQERAQAMEEAAALTSSGMLAVIGLAPEVIRQAAGEEGFHIANINAPTQIVISLQESDKARITEKLAGLGARVVPLEVNAGFHSPFMQPAKERLLRRLQQLSFKDAVIPIVSNVTAKPHTSGVEIKENLAQQLIASVLWSDCVQCMAQQGVKTFYEVGPSKVLRGLLRKIDSGLKVMNIEKPQDLDLVTV